MTGSGYVLFKRRAEESDEYVEGYDVRANGFQFKTQGSQTVFARLPCRLSHRKQI